MRVSQTHKKAEVASSLHRLAHPIFQCPKREEQAGVKRLVKRIYAKEREGDEGICEIQISNGPSFMITLK